MDPLAFSENINPWADYSGDEVATTRVSSSCRYAGKPCMRSRARKLNGELHKMCPYHRLRANANQRRSQKRPKRQRQRLGTTDPGSLPRPLQDAVPVLATAEVTSHPFDVVTAGFNSVFTAVSNGVETVVASLAPSWCPGLGYPLVTAAHFDPGHSPDTSCWQLVNINGAYDANTQLTMQDVQFENDMPMPETSLTQPPEMHVIPGQGIDPVRVYANANDIVATPLTLSASDEAFFVGVFDGILPPESTASDNILPMTDECAGVDFQPHTDGYQPENVGILIPEQATKAAERRLARMSLDDADCPLFPELGVNEDEFRRACDQESLLLPIDCPLRFADGSGPGNAASPP